MAPSKKLKKYTLKSNPKTSEFADETAARDGDCESRESSCALDGAVRTLDVTSGFAPSGTPTDGSSRAPDADDWVSEDLLTPTHSSRSKPRKRGKKTKKKKRKNTHLRFESSDEEDSASANLPLSMSVSSSGGGVGSA